METACVSAASYATVPVPAAVSHAAIAIFTAFPALVIALLGWRVNRKDWGTQITHLQAENEKLTEALRLALYTRPPEVAR